MRPTEIVVTGRGPQLTDCKVTVYDVMPYWLANRPEGLIAWALNITPEQVVALEKYIDDHYDEVMAHHRKIEERIARGDPPEVRERIANTTNPRVLAYRAKIAEWRRKQEESNRGRRPV